MRTGCFMLAGIAALLVLPVAGRAQGTETTGSGKVQPYMRLQRVTIVTASAPVGEGKKPFSPLLETTAFNTLRGRFSLRRLPVSRQKRSKQR